MIDHKNLIRLQCNNCIAGFEQNGEQYLPITEKDILALAGKDGWEITTSPASSDIILAYCPECAERRYYHPPGHDPDVVNDRRKEDDLIRQADEMRKQ
jgi:hypothetical protein